MMWGHALCKNSNTLPNIYMMKVHKNSKQYKLEKKEKGKDGREK